MYLLILARIILFWLKYISSDPFCQQLEPLSDGQWRMLSLDVYELQQKRNQLSRIEPLGDRAILELGYAIWRYKSSCCDIGSFISITL